VLRTAGRSIRPQGAAAVFRALRVEGIFQNRSIWLYQRLTTELTGLTGLERTLPDHVQLVNPVAGNAGLNHQKRMVVSPRSMCLPFIAL
jgi:hypothetical protein